MNVLLWLEELLFNMCSLWISYWNWGHRGCSCLTWVVRQSLQVEPGMVRCAHFHRWSQHLTFTSEYSVLADTAGNSIQLSVEIQLRNTLWNAAIYRQELNPATGKLLQHTVPHRYNIYWVFTYYITSTSLHYAISLLHQSHHMCQTSSWIFPCFPYKKTHYFPADFLN